MTTQPDPQPNPQPDPDAGTLVEREGVDAGSARSTAEAALPAGGTLARAPREPETRPTQVWAESAGMAAGDPPDDGGESGQDEGLID